MNLGTECALGNVLYVLREVLSNQKESRTEGILNFLTFPH